MVVLYDFTPWDYTNSHTLYSFTCINNTKWYTLYSISEVNDTNYEKNRARYIRDADCWI